MKKNEEAKKIYVDETISEIFVSVIAVKYNLNVTINLIDPEGKICDCSILIYYSPFFKSCRLQVHIFKTN